MTELQALHAGAVRPPEDKSTAPEDPDTEIRGGTIEALLYGCVKWIPLKDHYNMSLTTHHRMLLRILGA